MEFVFFFKQKTAYEMRISDWSSDVCSSDLIGKDTQIPEQERNDEIGEDREKVPGERAFELRPDMHRIEIRRNPIEVPRPPKVQDRIKPGAHDSPKRHGFSEEIGRATCRERVHQYV